MQSVTVVDLGQGRVFVAASSRPGHGPYIVVEAANLWACSCPAKGSCKHIAEAKRISEAAAGAHVEVGVDGVSVYDGKSSQPVAWA